MFNLTNLKLFKSVWIFIILIDVCRGLECYYCSGQTYSDPNACFHPTPESTFIQTCETAGEWCETKRVWLDGWTEKIERGCSSNCNGRKYIWSEDFKVYCCNDKHYCNGATNSRSTISNLAIFCSGLVSLFLFRRQ